MNPDLNMNRSKGVGTKTLPRAKLFFTSFGLAALVMAGKNVLPSTSAKSVVGLPATVAIPAVLGAQSSVPAQAVVAAAPAAPTPTPTPTPVPPVAAILAKKSIKVKSTPTGFLNVRSEPSLDGSVIGKVYPGESYGYTSTEDGWYRIRLKSKQYGWVYGEYVVSSNG